MVPPRYTEIITIYCFCFKIMTVTVLGIVKFQGGYIPADFFILILSNGSISRYITTLKFNNTQCRDVIILFRRNSYNKSKATIILGISTAGGNCSISTNRRPTKSSSSRAASQLAGQAKLGPTSQGDQHLGSPSPKKNSIKPTSSIATMNILVSFLRNTMIAGEFSMAM